MMQMLAVDAVKNKTWLGLFILACLTALILFALEAGKPTAPLAADASLSVFSAERAMPHLFKIAQQPHPIGTPENAKVRAYLIAELRALGLAPEVQSTLGVFKSPRGLSAGQVNNVLVRLPGTALDHASRKALMLSAHYDSVPQGPGAGDDGASVAAILETLRALKNEMPLQNDLICLFTDGEEVGLLGAEAFVAEHPWAHEVGLALNFEYRGNRGAMLMFETSPGNGRLIEGMAQAVAHPIANSLNYEIYKLLPNDTDLSSFKRAGIPGLNFSAIEGHTSYHTALDRPELLDKASLQHQGDIMLSLVRHFGSQDLAKLKGGDQVYFDFPGYGLVHYPVQAVLPLTVFTAALFLVVCVFGIRKKHLRLGRIFLAALAFLLVLATLAAAAQGLWMYLLRIHPAYRLMLQGTTYNSHWYLLAFLSLTLGLFMLMQRSLQRWMTTLEQLIGSLLLWLICLAVASALMPGASFLLSWPLLAILLCIAVFFLRPQLDPLRAVLLLLVALAPAVLLFAPLLRAVFIGLGPNMVFVMVGAFVLLLGLMAGLFAVLPRHFPLAALGLGVGFLLAGAATAGFDASQPQPVNLFYIKDAKANLAYWISDNATLNNWSRNFFPGIAQRQPMPGLFGDDAGLFWASRAPDVGLSAPSITVLEDKSDGTKRMLSLEVKSLRAEANFLVTLEGAKVLRSSLNGRPLTDTPRAQWALRASGMQDRAVQLGLEIEASKDFRIRVRERSFGLPLNNLPARPAEIMHQPFGSSDSSQSVQVMEFKKF